MESSVGCVNTPALICFYSEVSVPKIGTTIQSYSYSFSMILKLAISLNLSFKVITLPGVLIENMGSDVSNCIVLKMFQS